MEAALHVSTKILPGHKVEFVAPEIEEGKAIEVFVVIPRNGQPLPRQSMLDLVKSLPPGPRSYKSWEEFERIFQEERNSWER